MSGLFWLSFADGTRPEGEQCLGVALVEAAGSTSAIIESHRLGINPGGEVMFMSIDPDQRARLTFELPVGRLIPPAEANALADRIESELAS